MFYILEKNEKEDFYAIYSTKRNLNGYKELLDVTIPDSICVCNLKKIDDSFEV